MRGLSPLITAERVSCRPAKPEVHSGTNTGPGDSMDANVFLIVKS